MEKEGLNKHKDKVYWWTHFETEQGPPAIPEENGST